MIFGFTLSEYSVNEIKQQTATGKDPANAIAGHSSETSAEAPYDDFGMVLPELSQQVPVEERDPNDKPDNGVCFNDGTLVCSIPGAIMDYVGAPGCIFCFCNDNHGVTCCREKPYPHVEDPSLCKLFLDPESCEYQRSKKCKSFCKILGWYFSDISHLLSVPLAMP
ncbi:hypothetical protein BSL78_20169 [Apostichopus japonicus]|uniref:Uncharacterized protein n=1 Tax=Stichopus japonicus TaxID=307972 RepID=A0A2G8K4R0_STIJA|nr:hypothetical protein BSL78_20169 [Apostichopus japonicus]